jgi:hypothetical protein
MIALYYATVRLRIDMTDTDRIEEAERPFGRRKMAFTHAPIGPIVNVSGPQSL